MKNSTQGFFQTRQKAFIAIVACFLGTSLIPSNNLSFQPYTFQSFVAGLLFGLGVLALYQELKKEIKTSNQKIKEEN